MQSQDGPHEWLKEYVRDIPDFPKQGIVFKDITPLLREPRAYTHAIDALTGEFDDNGIDKVVGIEARGFMLAAPLAYGLRAGLVPVRKKGKLPWEVVSETYELEYGTDQLEVHRDGIADGDRVLIVDDVLATGGTAAATARLIERCGGRVVGVAVLMELGFLRGRERLAEYEVFSLICY